LKIAITGASGVVGRRLVSEFTARGAQLLLVGRDKAMLNTLFPGLECCNYDELPNRAAGYDGVLHLAVLNNNSGASEDEFVRVNVDLTNSILAMARMAGIPRFVYVSTTQALNPRNHSFYAATKRSASENVLATTGMRTSVLYPSAVTGDRLTGHLKVLNRFPPTPRAALLDLYGALTPIVDHSAVIEECWQALTQSDFPSQKVVTRDQSLSVAFNVVKRSIDIATALLILVLFSWLLAIIWLSVKIQSSGPGIFAQERVGKDGAIFTCYKFRTMAEGSPNLGSHEVSASLVTPIGGILRRTKLDELPQAINILLNQMSLVGPRPSLPNQTAVVSEREGLGVLAIKPGITGLSQVNKIDMSQPVDLARCDAEYAELRSLRLDLSILIQTLRGSGRGDAIGGSNHG
jgi:lipopolysaccharide/colanic/teichoic acid biosynthesis glycosyltransferase